MLEVNLPCWYTVFDGMVGGGNDIPICMTNPEPCVCAQVASMTLQAILLLVLVETLPIYVHGVKGPCPQKGFIALWLHKQTWTLNELTPTFEWLENPILLIALVAIILVPVVAESFFYIALNNLFLVSTFFLWRNPLCARIFINGKFKNTTESCRG